MDKLINQTIYFNQLLEVYGELLTSTQQEILESYYALNLSISEISIERGISRAAVEDTIKKGSRKLEFYEEKLSFVEKKTEITKAINDLKEMNLSDEANEIIDFIEINL